MYGGCVLLDHGLLHSPMSFRTSSSTNFRPQSQALSLLPPFDKRGRGDTEKERERGIELALKWVN